MNQGNVTNSGRKTEKMAAALQQAGLRVTTQRVALLQVIDETEDPPAVEELFRRALTKDPRISIATVYRAGTGTECAGS